MEKNADDWVFGGSLNYEGGQLAVVDSFISESLHQLEQVIAELLIVCPLQYLHRMAPHLAVIQTQISLGFVGSSEWYNSTGIC